MNSLDKAVHSALRSNKVLRDWVESQARSMPKPPKDGNGLQLAYDEGRRSMFAEIVSMFEVVENQIGR